MVAGCSVLSCVQNLLPHQEDGVLRITLTKAGEVMLYLTGRIVHVFATHTIALREIHEHEGRLWNISVGGTKPANTSWSDMGDAGRFGVS